MSELLATGLHSLQPAQTRQHLMCEAQVTSHNLTRIETVLRIF